MELSTLQILILLAFCSLLWPISSLAGNVTYDHRSIIINGQRKLLISAAIHYPRSVPAVRPIYSNLAFIDFVAYLLFYANTHLFYPFVILVVLWTMRMYENEELLCSKACWKPTVWCIVPWHFSFVGSYWFFLLIMELGCWLILFEWMLFCCVDVAWACSICQGRRGGCYRNLCFLEWSRAFSWQCE